VTLNHLAATLLEEGRAARRAVPRAFGGANWWGVSTAISRPARARTRPLRHAQADLLQGAAGDELKLPFHWAAFQLTGDWR